MSSWLTSSPTWTCFSSSFYSILLFSLPGWGLFPWLGCPSSSSVLGSPFIFLLFKVRGRLGAWQSGKRREGALPSGWKLAFSFCSSMIIANSFKQQITYTASVHLLPTDFSDLHIRLIAFLSPPALIAATRGKLDVEIKNRVLQGQTNRRGFCNVTVKVGKETDTLLA